MSGIIFSISIMDFKIIYFPEIGYFIKDNSAGL